MEVPDPSKKCPMPDRLVSNAFLVAGLALLGLGVYFYSAPASGPLLQVAETDIEVPDLPPGIERTVLFHLDNASSEPLRVLGVMVC
jgi:hypothetical protein